MAAASPMTRSARSSSSVESPYPDFASSVVVPPARAASNRATASPRSSSSLAARVAATVRRIPPAA